MDKQVRIEELKQLIEEKGAEFASIDAVQYALKIFLNSFYGVFSNEYFRYFDLRLASAVTCNGQVCIQGPTKYLKDNLPDVPVIYNDTDSLFLGMLPILKNRFPEMAETTPERKRDFIVKFNKQVIAPLIAEYYEKMTGALNTLRNTFEMDFEVISDKTLFVGKKRYVMKLVYKDGYNIDLTGKPELKTKGIEVVRTSTPGVVRKKLKELLVLAMTTDNNDECIEFIDKFRDEFKKMTFDQVANPRTVNGIKKYKLGDKSVPIHVRASHVFNQALSDLGLQNLEPIRESDKCRFAYIKVPNEFGQNVIACKTTMPPEIQNKFEIDYDLQFDKAALAPIQGIFNAMGWSTEKIASLKAFFS